jgi:hypothetical protein
MFFLFALACGEKATDSGQVTSTTAAEPNFIDNDGDGFEADEDCNDEDATIYPGSVAESTELCLMDQDGDGFGDANATAPYDAGTDCADSDPLTFPGAAENESETICQTDADEDGYGSSTPADGVEAGQDEFDSDPNLWVAPTEGAWDFAEATDIVNNCEISEDPTIGEVDTGFNLASTGNANFNITMNGATEATSCSLTSGNFSCSIPATTEVIELPEYDLTVDLRFTTTLSGVFSASGVLASDFVLTVECTDTDNLFISCSALSDYLPCTASWSMPATVAQ